VRMTAVLLPHEENGSGMDYGAFSFIAPTTRILRSGEASDFFYPPLHDIKPFRFFVYNSLTQDVLPYNVSQCIRDKIGEGNTCDWGLSTCTLRDVTEDQEQYVRYRHNYNADVVQADLFLRYPMEEGNKVTSTKFATRTENPHDADIFVVPYPHDSHCKCVAKRPAPGCSDYDGRMAPQLHHLFQDQLPYYNSSTEKRHLFLTGSNHVMAHEIIQNKTLKTSKGFAANCRYRHQQETYGTCGTIVTATHKALPEYQPTYLQRKLESQWWTTRTRQYSLVGFFGRQDEAKVETVRNQLLDRIPKVFPSNFTIGGLPVIVGDSLSGARTLSNELGILHAYQNSTFCLILPGDLPTGNRVFDTMQSGCIPVFLKFGVDPYGDPIWFKLRPDSDRIRIPKRVVYPFAKGIFWDTDNVGIDYESMVVQIDMKSCGLECIAPTLEGIMANETELTRLRTNLRKHAALFSYGLQDNAYKTFDAFGLLLWQLGYYASLVSDNEKKRSKMATKTN
ncbi:MAG: hypothetical protein SGILL_008831, partial [Bacillariaceae sp.]